MATTTHQIIKSTPKATRNNKNKIPRYGMAGMTICLTDIYNLDFLLGSNVPG